MKKWLGHGIAFVYILLAVFITLCLLSYNDYGVLETTEHNYVVLDEGIDNYPEGSLLSFDKCTDLGSLKEKNVYYFNLENKLVKGHVTDIIEDSEETVLEIERNLYYSDRLVGEKVLGSYPTWGKLLHFFTSKYVYLFAIIFPTLLLFLYEIYLLIKYIKRNGNKKVEKVNDNKQKNKD